MNNNQIDKITTDAEGPKGKLSEKQVGAWLQEISTQKGKEKSWRIEAGKISALYEGYKSEASPFNILYSNTDTLSPALYNNTPRPAVGRRFKDKDPLGAAVCMTLNRTLAFSLDSNDADQPEFDTLAEHAILQALVPGRGVVRWKYAADYVTPGGVKATIKQDAKDIPNTAAEGQAAQLEPVEPIAEVKNERLCGEMVEYDRFLCGYAKKWSQVPWVSFEHHMTKEELETNFGKELADRVKCGELEEEPGSHQDEATKDKRKVAVVYELWNKADRTVIFVSPGLKDRELRLVDDPLNLSGFYPCDEPLMFMLKVSSMIPQPIYNLYRKQAEELNQITNRITIVMECLKVRGAYDSAVTEMSKILKADDGEMVAVENVQMLGEGADLKKAIFLMPLAELVSVLQQLYMQRTQIKTVIYEITGISDILRGSSVASETATAQTIKNDWGTLRLKKSQKKVQKWCRNNLRIMGEIAARKFSQKTFMRMTELPYVTKEQHDMAQMEMKQFMEQQQQVQMQAQQQQAMQTPAPGQPPMQPPAPVPPPQNLVDTLATPIWEEIIALMRSPTGMEFRVDIETNSTIADDMAEDQKNIGELLNALSQFLNGVAPLIENKTMPFEVAKAMMLGIVRKMAMGPEIEDLMDKMKEPEPPPEPPAPPPPPPPPPDPNIQLKAQAEATKLQMEMKRLEMEGQQMQLEMQLAQQEFENKMKLEQQKMQVGEQKFILAMKTAQMKAATALTPENTVPEN